MEDLETVGKTAEMKKPKSVRGTWCRIIPEDADIEADIREIRDEWKKEVEEIFEFETEDKESLRKKD